MNLIETIENKLITLINEKAVYDIDGSNMNLEEIKVLTELLKTIKKDNIIYTQNLGRIQTQKYNPNQFWYNNTITTQKRNERT